MQHTAIVTEQSNTLNNCATEIKLSMKNGTHNLPLTSFHITQLFDTYSQVILQERLSTTDRLMQGSSHDLHALIIQLFTIIAIERDRSISIEKQSEIPPFNTTSKRPLLCRYSTLDPLRNKTVENSVSSVQRWKTTKQLNAHTIAYMYFRWLNTFVKPLLTVTFDEKCATFHLKGVSTPLLHLEKVPDLTTQKISEWKLTGGLLNKEKNTLNATGRLWFVVAYDAGQTTIWTALTHFQPSLPWYLYKYTQGLLHPWVMNRFAKSVKTSRSLL
ncbi:hypothetical protein [Salipaludibacillus agaradhaerens]|uniref:hypothetical protein n=1 Tax=Salipaludibacillus agaradhaerens TaxID=76935 RepID=UPI000996B614|nr:hypothetical protein [Salipaludibacillus agaradhaerens]